MEEEHLPLVDLAPGVSADKSPQDNTEKTKQEVLGQIHDQDKVKIVAKTAEVKPDSSPQVKTPTHDNATKPESTAPPATAEMTEAKQPAPKPVTPTPKPKPPVKTGATHKPQTRSLTGTAWLKAQNPSHYTVQLNASRSLQSIRDYIRQHHLASKTTYMKTTLKGKDWYILLYGSYPNKQSARQAAAKLPAALRKAGPWPRRIGDIKPASH